MYLYICKVHTSLSVSSGHLQQHMSTPNPGKVRNLFGGACFHALRSSQLLAVLLQCHGPPLVCGPCLTCQPTSAFIFLCCDSMLFGTSPLYGRPSQHLRVFLEIPKICTPDPDITTATTRPKQMQTHRTPAPAATTLCLPRLRKTAEALAKSNLIGRSSGSDCSSRLLFFFLFQSKSHGIRLIPRRHARRILRRNTRDHGSSGASRRLRLRPCSNNGVGCPLGGVTASDMGEAAANATPSSGTAAAAGAAVEGAGTGTDSRSEPLSEIRMEAAAEGSGNLGRQKEKMLTWNKHLIQSNQTHTIMHSHRRETSQLKQISPWH